ncbi:MAG: glycoside hydrolase family 15 protein [Nitrospiria bacterium]
MKQAFDDFISEEAPGAPGISPTWSSSDKEMVGSTIGPSRLWFTIGRGIINEIYYPRVDIPQIRDLGFIVSDFEGFWVEVKRMDNHELRIPSPGVPAVEVIHRHERFILTLRITPDPNRDVLLIEVILDGNPELRICALLAPHLGATGYRNRAAVATYRGRRVMWAEQGPFGMAIAAANERQSEALNRASAGYVGTSDGWQDFARNGAMKWQFRQAGPGNVALMGELSHRSILALGFGSSRESAATLAISALLQPFEQVWRRQIFDWEQWHGRCDPESVMQKDLPEQVRNQLLVSSMVLRVHQDKVYPGAMVASLSIPWGNSREERGGYHLVWPRDLVQCGGALLALGAEEEARNILRYLIATQHQDGKWYQNQWLGGKPFWNGIQLDEIAFPVLLATELSQRGALNGIEVEEMIRKALGFLARVGPSSDQDRWEENPGINTFTLSVCIAAMVEGAQFLSPAECNLLLDLADYWNAHIEDWTAVFDTALARRLGVNGYYIRVAPKETVNDRNAFGREFPIKNLGYDPGLKTEDHVGVDFLQLVRFGLRRPDDPLILDSLRVIDSLLKVETPSGPSWRRYNGDGYGEQEDGTPFNGAGVGRIWPLLTGERGHYELASGRDPLPYLNAMTAMSGTGGMLPEQVWDTHPISSRKLYPGRPTGSAMPLAWAHAEFIKLLVSRQLGHPYDRPKSVWRRYKAIRPRPNVAFWSEQFPISRIEAGARLQILLQHSNQIHWGFDGWREARDVETVDYGLGVHVAELQTKDLRAGQWIDFTFRNSITGRWAGEDYHISVILDKL